MSERRQQIRHMIEEHLSHGDYKGWFEELYATAHGDPACVPWADLAPNPGLEAWLATQEAPQGPARALVVGCGLGDDAQRLAQAGYQVTAFDISPTAIHWCQRRFPQSPVHYLQADLFEAPSGWLGAFDLIFECYTLQAMPEGPRQRAMPLLAQLLAPQGRLLIIARTRREEDPDQGGPPWALPPSQFAPLEREPALRRLELHQFMDQEEPPVLRLRGLYQRTA